MRLKSVASRLIVLVGVVLLPMLVIGVYQASAALEERLVHEAYSGLHRLGDTLKRSLRYDMRHDDREGVTNAIRNVGAQAGIDAIRIYNKEGEICFSSDEAELHTRVGIEDDACKACHKRSTPVSKLPPEEMSTIMTSPDGHRGYHIVQPIYNERACSVAACHVHSADQKVLGLMGIIVSLDQIDAELSSLRKRAFVAMGVGILLLVLVIYLAVRRTVTRPIKDLLKGTRVIASGHLTHRIPVLARDEIGVLARSFNQMTGTLQETRGQLLQSERLASLGRLGAGIAHEINNPLTGVLLFASTLLDDLEEGDARRENLELIVSETTRCREIIRGLLDFARQTQPKVQSARIGQVIDRAVRIVRNQASVEHIEIKHCGADECDVPPLRMDPKQIQQVILNLVLNAVDATPDGGEIVISCKQEDERFALLTVTDSGSGIPPEDLAHVFEPFYSTKGNKGTGLGLAISWGIIEQHGGTIEAASTPGQGTRFSIRLPLADNPEFPGPLAGEGASGSGGEEQG